MTKQTHVIDGTTYCGTLETALPFVGMRDATLGACTIPPGTEPPGRIRTMTAAFGNYIGQGKVLIDVTQYANLFRLDKNTPVPFPGSNLYTVFYGWGPGAYIAAEFVAPSDIGNSGRWTHGETLPGANMDCSISTSPGDFGPTALQSVHNAGPGQGLGSWKQPSAVGNQTILVPGQHYYINFRFTDPNASAPAASINANHNKQ